MSTPGDHPARGLPLPPHPRTDHRTDSGTATPGTAPATGPRTSRRRSAVRRGGVALEIAALLLPVLAQPASAAPTAPDRSATAPAAPPADLTTTGPTTTGGSGTSSALASTSARAEALRGQLDALAVQLETATEDHAAAVAELQRVVAEEVAAERALDEARATAEADRLRAASRVRALAQQGRVGLTVEAIGVAADPAGGALDPTDLLAGYRVVSRAAASDATTARRAQESSAAAADRAAELLALRDRQLVLESTSRDVLADAQRAVDVQTALLATADAQVLALAAQQTQELDAAARAAGGAWATGSATGSTATGTGVGGTGVGGTVTTAGAPASAEALAAISVAETALGLPYRWGATGPDSYDCSGLVQWAFGEVGISLPRTTRAQYAALPHVPVDQARAGDLLYFASGPDPSSIHHMGIYLGDGMMLHAPRTGDVVKVSAVKASSVYGVARPSVPGAP